MKITEIIFAMSFLLFASYTVVSLAFLNRKRNALHNELHTLVAKEMVNSDGRLTPDPEIAMKLLQSMDSKFQAYQEESNETNSNVMKLSIMTTIIGVLLAITHVIM